MFVSGLYGGLVHHARFRPRRHRLRYAIFMLLLDLDELPALNRGLKLFGVDRFRLVGFSGRDHLGRSPVGLKTQVETHLRAAGMQTGGPVRLLCMPRILGGTFNPLSVYFCHGPNGDLTAVLYEVSNTFGERHSYLIPVVGDGTIEQGCDKTFYVSPFMDMDLTYAFKIEPPGERVSVTIEVSDQTGPLLVASFAGARQDLTDRALWRAWLGHPLMTLGVIWAIHWEALKIWLKGEHLRPRPKPPTRPVTVVPGALPVVQRGLAGALTRRGVP